MAKSEIWHGWRVGSIPEKFAESVHPLIAADARAFSDAFYRTYAVGRLFNDAVRSGRQYDQFYRCVLQDRLQRPYIMRDENGTPEDIGFNARDAVRDAMHNPDTLKCRLFLGGPVDDEVALEFAERGNPSGVQAMLEMFVLLGWTAFESFVGDIWEHAVDACPDPLAINILDAGRNARPKDSDQPDAKIPLAWLTSNEFDLRNNMGAILKSAKHVNLDSIDGIQAAYKRAFLLPNKKSSQVLEDAFSVAYSDVRVLWAIRNLTAHRAGRVDAIFKNRIKGHALELESLEIDTVLKLDSDRVKKHVGAAIKLAVTLCKYITTWLHDNVRAGDEAVQPKHGRS